MSKFKVGDRACSYDNDGRRYCGEVIGYHIKNNVQGYIISSSSYFHYATYWCDEKRLRRLVKKIKKHYWVHKSALLDKEPEFKDNFLKITEVVDK